MIFHLDSAKFTQRNILEHVMRGQVYEPESTKAIGEELKPGEMFFDVGANCGWFSAVALARGARVTAFEPDEDNCATLKLNAPAAEIVEAAVSDNPGEIRLFINLDNDGGHSLWPCGLHQFNAKTAAENSPPSKMVRSVTLDEFADLEPVAIKIDTEGAECNVLLGAEKVLGNPKLRLVVCECHAMGLDLLGHQPAEIEAIMTRHGFTWDQPSDTGFIENWIFRRITWLTS